MVGITVGLATVLVITQTMSLFQGGRNTAVSGAGAQENGLFAMHLVATDIRSSGAGSYATNATGNTQSMYGCTNVCSFYGGAKGVCSNNGNPTATSGAIAAISGYALTGADYKLRLPMFPVIIESGNGAGISGGVQYSQVNDIVTVRSPARFIGSVPTSTSSQADMAGAIAIGVTRTFGHAANDLALIMSGTNCLLFEVTSVDSTGLGHASGTSYNPSSYQWTSSSSTAGTCPAGEAGQCYGNGAMVYNLGTNTGSPIIANEYSVAAGATTLQMRSIGTTNSSSVPTVLSMADNIVAMRAQYGIAAAANSATVSTWVGPDSSAWDTTWKPGALTVANAGLIRAVRIVVVARSGNREAATVTSACTTDTPINYTTGPCPSGSSSDPNIQSDTTMPAINLSGLPWNTTTTEWQHYRYKIYTTVVPIRNILWNGSWNYTGGSYTGQ